MKTLRPILPQILKKCFFKGLILGATLVNNNSYGAGVVNTPDQASLTAALEGGGLVTFECDGTIYLTNTITIGSNTVLDGNGRSIAISGSNAVRVLLVETNTELTLSGLSIINGKDPEGAGLYNNGGLVTISNCSFLGNHATGLAGVNGSNQVPSTPGGNGRGGAVFNKGVLNLHHSVLANNMAAGGVGGAGYLANYAPRTGGNGVGGGIYNEGYLVAADTSFQTNSAAGGNAADWPIQSGWGPPGGGAASGGALYNSGGLYATNCVLEGNAAGGGTPQANGTGGAVENGGGQVQFWNCSIRNNGSRGGGSTASTSSGGAFGGALGNLNGGNVEVNNCSLIANWAAGMVAAGGAVYNGSGTLTIQSSTVSSNHASSGAFSYRGNGGSGQNSSAGGIFNSGDLVLRDTVLNNNSAAGGGGITGPFGAFNGGSAEGGALQNQGAAILSDCTVISNGVSGGGGSFNLWMPFLRGADGQTFGAGIANSGQLVVTNTTIAFNSSQSTSTGGAAGIYTTIPLTATNSVIASNELRLRIDVAANSFTVGSPGVFSVAGNHLGNTGYQWFSMDTNLIIGATERTYVKENLQSSDAGIYRVHISDSIGGLRTIVFNMAPRIAKQPSTQYVIPGGGATFAPEVEGSEPIHYQWRFDGADIPGATVSSFTLTNAQNEHVGNYSLFASNQFGVVTSSNAALLLVSPPVVQVPMENQVAAVGATVSFQAQISGNGFYQWYFQSAIIPGATNATYSFAAQPSRIGIYTVILSNAVATAQDSAEFNMAPYITVQPALSFSEQTVLPGTSKSLQVAANGSQPLSYQWRLNGEALTGATESSYTAESMTTAQSGKYSVVVSNDFGGVTSVDVNLQAFTTLHWQLQGGKSTAWYFNNGVFIKSVQKEVPTMPSSWRRLDVADLNDDKEPDYLWRHTNGAVAVSLINRTQPPKNILLRKGTPLANSWNYVGTGDFNHDGKTDILWQNGSRQLMSWFMNGTNFLSGGLLRNGQPVASGWTPVKAHDFDGDGNSDILLQHVEGRVNLWKMDRTNAVASLPIRAGVSPGRDWKVVHVHDFNYDGQKDILFRHVNGGLRVWYLNQANYLTAQTLQRNGPAVSTGARLVGVE